MLHPTFKPYTDTITAPSVHPTFKPYTDTITAPSAARPKRRNTTVCLTRHSNRWETLAPEPRQRMRNGTQMKKKLTVQWTASEWQLRPRLAWTSGSREHGVDDACETAKPQQDSSPRGGQKGPECDAKVCLTRPSNPLKTLGPEPRLVCCIQRSNPIQSLLPHPRFIQRSNPIPWSSNKPL